MCPLRVIVSTVWLGQGVIRSGGEAGPVVSMVLLVWFCCFSGPGAETGQRPGCHPSRLMLKGVVAPGPTWESHKATLQPHVPPPRGSTT